MEGEPPLKKAKKVVVLPRITFVTPTKAFERLFNETSLDELKAAVRKKLNLSNDANIQLAQSRGDVNIDLEDADDFAAFEVYAKSNLSATVRVALESQDIAGSSSRRWPNKKGLLATTESELSFDSMSPHFVHRRSHSRSQPLDSPVTPARGIESSSTNTASLSSPTKKAMKRKRKSGLDAEPGTDNQDRKKKKRKLSRNLSFLANANLGPHYGAAQSVEAQLDANQNSADQAPNDTEMVEAINPNVADGPTSAQLPAVLGSDTPSSSATKVQRKNSEKKKKKSKLGLDVAPPSAAVEEQPSVTTGEPPSKPKKKKKTDGAKTSKEKTRSSQPTISGESSRNVDTEFTSEGVVVGSTEVVTDVMTSEPKRRTKSSVPHGKPILATLPSHDVSLMPSERAVAQESSAGTQALSAVSDKAPRKKRLGPRGSIPSEVVVETRGESSSSESPSSSDGEGEEEPSRKSRAIAEYQDSYQDSINPEELLRATSSRSARNALANLSAEEVDEADEGRDNSFSSSSDETKTRREAKKQIVPGAGTKRQVNRALISRSGVESDSDSSDVDAPLVTVPSRGASGSEPTVNYPRNAVLSSSFVDQPLTELPPSTARRGLTTSFQELSRLPASQISVSAALRAVQDAADLDTAVERHAMEEDQNASTAPTPARQPSTVADAHIDPRLWTSEAGTSSPSTDPIEDSIPDAVSVRGPSPIQSADYWPDDVDGTPKVSAFPSPHPESLPTTPGRQSAGITHVSPLTPRSRSMKDRFGKLPQLPSDTPLRPNGLSDLPLSLPVLSSRSTLSTTSDPDNAAAHSETEELPPPAGAKKTRRGKLTPEERAQRDALAQEAKLARAAKKVEKAAAKKAENAAKEARKEARRIAKEAKEAEAKNPDSKSSNAGKQTIRRSKSDPAINEEGPSRDGAMAAAFLKGKAVSQQPGQPTWTTLPTVATSSPNITSSSSNVDQLQSSSPMRCGPSQLADPDVTPKNPTADKSNTVQSPKSSVKQSLTEHSRNPSVSSVEQMIESLPTNVQSKASASASDTEELPPPLPIRSQSARPPNSQNRFPSLSDLTYGKLRSVIVNSTRSSSPAVPQKILANDRDDEEDDESSDDDQDSDSGRGNADIPAAKRAGCSITATPRRKKSGLALF